MAIAAQRWAGEGPDGGPAGGVATRRRLGEVLVDSGVLTRDQLEQALRAQREDPGGRRRLGEVITELRFADEVQIARALSDQLRLPFVDLASMSMSEVALRALPRHVAVRLQVVPVALAHDVLTIAMSDPTNVVAMDDIRMATGFAQIRATVATASDLRDAVNRHYGGQGAAGEAAANAIGALKDIQGIEILEDLGEDDGDGGVGIEDAPVVRLVNAIMGEALYSRASDVHIEPRPRDVGVRLRIDGLLREVMVVPKAIQGALISRIKILSGMDIAERRRPQDGRGKIRHEGQEADTRVSSMPSMHGETVVIRLLRKEGEKAKSLSEIGLGDTDRAKLEQAIREPQGLVLITGPTGSGKTSTLYAALGIRIEPTINVVTLEDPVEGELPGVNQVQINERAGLTFAGGLRTILRQDPDVVMVGEIRDPETAAISMQASMTGHLVLSTLHTNDAPSAVGRLLDMGVEPYLITSSLTLVVAQRLARVPCPRCAEPVQADPRTLELLGIDPSAVDTSRLRRGAGCGSCSRTGYQGRIGLFQVLTVTRHLRDLVVERAPEGALQDEAVASGMRSMRADGLAKALAGVTTLEEVLRVTPADSAGQRRDRRPVDGEPPTSGPHPAGIAD